MKKLSLYLVLLAPFILKGQISIFNISLRDTTKNELYLGCENIIHIPGINTSSDDVFVKASIGKLKKNATGKYYYERESHVKYDIKTDTISIYKKGKSIFKQVFEMKIIPYEDAYFQFGGKRDSILTVRDILTSPFVKYTIPPSNYKDYKKIDYPSVSKFTITIISKNQNRYVFKEPIGGGILYYNYKDEIRKLQSGDRIILEDIVIVGQLICPKLFEEKITITIE